MVTTNNNNNQVNLEQVCSLNIEQSRLLQYAISPTPTLRSVAKNQDGDILGTKRGISIVSYFTLLHGIAWYHCWLCCSGCITYLLVDPIDRSALWR